MLTPRLFGRGFAVLLLVVPAPLNSQSWLTYRGTIDGTFTASCPNNAGTPVPKAGMLRFNFYASGNDAKTRFVSEWSVEAGSSPRTSTTEDQIDADGGASGNQVFVIGGGTIAWTGRFIRASDGSVQASGSIAPESGDEFGCTGTWRAGAAASPTAEPSVCDDYKRRLVLRWEETITRVEAPHGNIVLKLATLRDQIQATHGKIVRIKAGTLTGMDLEQQLELRRISYAQIQELEAVRAQLRANYLEVERLATEARAAGCDVQDMGGGPRPESEESPLVEDLLRLGAYIPPTPVLGVAGVQGIVEFFAVGRRGPLHDSLRIPLDQPVIIRTGPGSSVTIQVGSVQKTLRPMTTIRIVPNSSGQANFIEEGAVTVDVQKPGANQIQTPTATAKVDGTIFTVSYDPATGITGIMVYEGRVTAEPTNLALRGVTLSPGEYVEISRDAISAVLPAPRAPERLPTAPANPVPNPPVNPPADQPAPQGDLTGLWLDDSGGGGVYRVRQVGTRLYWSVDGTSRGSYNNVAFGDITGNTISLKWVDLPGSPTLGGGDLTLRIESNDRLVKINSTANYPPGVWTRQGNRPGTVTPSPAPPPAPAPAPAPAPTPAPAPPPPAAPPVRPGQYLSVQVNGQTAILNWSNAPTTPGTWVSIVPAGTPDGTHTGRWRYTENQAAGTYQDGPLDPGAYEARFYADAEYGKLADRVRFNVGTDAALMMRTVQGELLRVLVDQRSFAVLTWSNAPATMAWVSVVPAGTAESAHANRWLYTAGTAAGRFETGPLPAGEYEARFYGDTGYGKLIEKVRFRVP